MARRIGIVATAFALVAAGGAGAIAHPAGVEKSATVGKVSAFPGSHYVNRVACAPHVSPKTGSCEAALQQRGVDPAAYEVSVIHAGKPKKPTKQSPGGFGITCPSKTTCVLAGESADGVGTLEWLVNGKPAGIVTVSGSSEIVDVACQSVTRCVGVGHLGLTEDRTGVAVVATKGTKTVAAKPVTGVTALNAVACGSSASCYAVGSSGTPSAGNGVLVKIHGTSIGAAAKVAKTRQLADISCGSATHCLAAGTVYSNAKGTLNLVVPIVAGKPKKPLLTPAAIAVSCANPTACAVAGEQSAGEGTEATVYVQGVIKGKLGHKVPIGDLSGVSDLACPVAHSCVIVGTDQDEAAVVVLASP